MDRELKERCQIVNPVDPHPPKTPYQTEEVQEILQLALLHRSDGGELSRAQLLEMAVELDIPPEALQAAEQEWLAQQVVEQERLAFERARWSNLKQQIGQYAIVNGFLVLLNLSISHNLSWSLYVLLSWGMGLSLKIWKTAQTHGEDYERSYESWQRRRQIKRSAQKLWTRVQRVLS